MRALGGHEVPTVKQVESAIERVEGFRVRILHPDGRDVRSDRTQLPRYDFERKLSGDRNVKAWKDIRFIKKYSGWRVEVLDSRGRDVHGGTLLSNVRDGY